MAITILAPVPAALYHREDSDESDDGGVDLEGDVDIRPAKRARHSFAKDIVTPGETITDDPQWMRYAEHFLPYVELHAKKFSEVMAHSVLPQAQKL